ncbi:pseudouridine synthase [Sulfuricystis multivorans]|uniref:pseudouridine synthase n=1 Tax=Sulfuricystis multivorans TaxID=2211108 RepID=UPI000F83AFF3|nr:16S rRNA pseudouridine(516) synthase [Sulfuricystis multivorans]
MSRLTLDRMLQSQGFGSRKACRGLIEAGAVKIDGEIIADWRIEIETDGLEFEVDGRRWAYREHVYLALDKPAGVECSRRPSHHPGVLSLLPAPFTLRGVQPVGRLDHDTTGLLLLSDDGAFIHALTHPKRHVSKTYRVTTAEPITQALIERLCSGVQLADEPAPLAAQARQTGEHELEIVLEQGKYHQVKRMLAAAGSHCVALRRIAIGGLALESLGLAEGGWCFLDDEPLERLTSHGRKNFAD